MADDTPHRWWQTVPGLLTAGATFITAVAGLVTVLVQAGFINTSKAEPAAPATAATAANESRDEPGRTSGDTRGDATTTGPSASSSAAAVGDLADLESRLTRANIVLSTGTDEDVARVRGYLSDPETGYRRLAESSLARLRGRTFIKPAYLDMIDKWYTRQVGADRFLSELNTDNLDAGIVAAHNQYYGTNASSFTSITR